MRTPAHATIFVLALAGSAGAQQYTVHELGTVTIQSAATAVNNAGIAVGWDLDLEGHFLAVRWTGSAPVGYPPPLGGKDHAHASAVNSAGDAAVILFTLGSLTHDAMIVNAGGFPSIVGSFQPRGMNDVGVIVGKRDTTLTSGWHKEESVRLAGGVLTVLGAATDVSSEASDVNNSGVVVGSYIAGGQLRPRACAWIGTQRFNLGTLAGGASAQAMAISDTGFVVGVSDGTGGLRHAYRLTLSPTGGVSNRIDLGELGRGFSCAAAVNAAGIVVGSSDSRAFVWENGVMTDLNDLISPSSGWELYAATGVTDDGRIVGWGRKDGAEARAFMLVPDSPCYADCDASGTLDFFDFLCFQNAFALGQSYADCDASGSLDFFDFLCFQNAFAAGCP